MEVDALVARVGDLRQLASVRQVILGDGAEAGVRALLFSTGGGLDFMVLVDRTLDVGTVHYRGVPVAWQSPAGFRHPGLGDALAENGTGFGRLFSGFLMTCGLEHIRQPGNGSPLHGRLPATPARLLGHGEDWSGEEPILFCDGEVIQASHGREALRLRRRIEAPIGGTTIRIFDEIQNCGPLSTPHALLYHCNLGHPAIADGSFVTLEQHKLVDGIALDDAEGLHEALCFPATGSPTTTCTVHRAGGTDPLRTAFTFSTATLPFVQLWRDLRPRVGVLAVEPCTSDRLPDGQSGTVITLEPGERRSYSLEIAFSGAAPGIYPGGRQ